MKKLTAILLIALMVVGMFACNKPAANEQEQAEAAETPVPATETPIPEPTEEPTPESTPEPTPDSTPEPTPEPTPEARVFVKNDIVQFGRFDGMNSKSGEVEPIEWRVLDVDGDRLFLLCETGLTDEVSFGDEEDFYRKWSDSYARIWLNGEFYETAFTPEEQAMIQETELTDPAVDDLHFYVPAYGREISLADPTTDRVFLLSMTEYEKYFGERCQYVKTGYIYHEYNEKIYSTVLDGWVLRTMGTYPGLGGICTVVPEGDYRPSSGRAEYSTFTSSALNEHGSFSDRDDCVLCPALWIQVPTGWDGFVRHEEDILPCAEEETEPSMALELGSYPLTEWTEWHKTHFFQSSWGGLFIDGNGNVWQLDWDTLTAQRLNINYADCFALGASYTTTIPVLRRDGSVVMLNYDEESGKVTQDSTVPFQQRFVRLSCCDRVLYGITQDGSVYSYRTWPGEEPPALMEGLPPLEFIQVIDTYLNSGSEYSYLGKGKDGNYYVWGLNIFSHRFVDGYDAVLSEPVRLDAFQDYYFVFLHRTNDGASFIALDNNRRLEIYDERGRLEGTMDNVAYLPMDSYGAVGFSGLEGGAITTGGEVYWYTYECSDYSGDFPRAFQCDYGGQEPMRFEEAGSGWFKARYLPGPIKEIFGSERYAFRLEDGRIIFGLNSYTNSRNEFIAGVVKDAKGQDIYFA